MRVQTAWDANLRLVDLFAMERIREMKNSIFLLQIPKLRGQRKECMLLGGRGGVPLISNLIFPITVVT